MHHFIFPSKDTYITNLSGLDNKNFGIDEILEVDAQSHTIRSITKYQSSSISSSNASIVNAIDYRGTFDGQFSGSTVNSIDEDCSSTVTVTVGNVNGSITDCADFAAQQFTGDFTGSLVGYVVGASINGTTYTDEFVSASVESSGSVDQLSGSISGSSVTGTISGSVYGQFARFSGSLDGVSGDLLGSMSGSYCYYNPHFSFETNAYLTRTLLKFDISTISSSVARGEIVDPQFFLNLKVLSESELPFDYKIYAFPISQSWAQGDGRYAEAGSDKGASWNYRDLNNGTRWYPSDITTCLYDYLTNESNKSVAFGNGGGTWYYSVPTDYVQPTSSVQTPFFSQETSSPTFDQEYSSSLDTNLSASFDDILSSSLYSVLNDAFHSKSNADGSYDLVWSIAVSTYENTSGSISASLALMDQSGSATCSGETYYQTEYSSSVAFLEQLSSSIQTIVHDSSSIAQYTDAAYLYDLVLSSSMSTLVPTTFDDVYSILNGWSYDAQSSSNSVLSVNDVYLGFSSSLSSEMGTTDPHLVYVNESMYPYLYTSSINLMDAQFTSSVTNDFSSSLVHYITDQISEIESQTSASVSLSLTEAFVSPFLSTLFTGSSLIMSQSYDYESSDIKMDVTQIVKSWIGGAIPNEGIILLSSEELNVSGSNGKLEFFSKETNTIYIPHLDVIWDNSEFLPGTLDPITGDVPFVATVKNLKKEYKHNSIVRINVFAKDKFSLKNFVKATQQSVHLTPKYLPEDTYYAIKDTETDELVVDFDIGTKLSCDSNGNYFVLDMTGLPQERYFKILIKTEINGGIEVIDNNTYFKVVR